MWDRDAKIASLSEETARQWAAIREQQKALKALIDRNAVQALEHLGEAAGHIGPKGGR